MGKTFFASDFHLGIDVRTTSREREKLLVRWLEEVAPQAGRLFLLGDLFDFWFEYKHAVPRGFTRLLGAIGRCSDAGIRIDVFTGNHDLWMRDYLSSELGVTVHREPLQTVIGESRFLIGHGDGLGPGDEGYKLMKKVFVHPLSRFIYRWLHPDIGIPLAQYFSTASRNSQALLKDYLGHDKEWLISYAEEMSKKSEYDFYVFGHRHLPIDYTLRNGRSRYINLGDWIYHQSYAEFDGKEMKLLFYQNDEGRIYH